MGALEESLQSDVNVRGSTFHYHEDTETIVEDATREGRKWEDNFNLGLGEIRNIKGGA